MAYIRSCGYKKNHLVTNLIHKLMDIGKENK